MRTPTRLLLALLLCVAAPASASASADKDKDGYTRNNRYMPSTDPNLDPNWNWTVSGPGHTLYYSDASGTIRSTVRQLPFYTSGHQLNTLEKDMYREDGWTLVYRDFGTPTAAPDMPFFALYNKYRGIFRVMLFNTRELQYSHFNLELSFKDSTATGAILTYSDPTRAFNTDFDPSKRESFLIETNALNGWLYGDFMLAGYDPNLNPATQLRLNIRGINVSQVTLNSTQFTLSQVLTEANPGASSTGAQALLDAVKKGHKYYKDTSSALKALKEAATKKPGAWWASTVLSIAKVAPYVGGLVGFIHSFIGGADDPAPREPLNFEGALDMSGSITQYVPLYSLDFGLQYFSGGNPPDYYRPLSNITWGIFNLTARPQVLSHMQTLCPTSSVEDCYFQTDYSLWRQPAYSFNPYSGMQRISVKYAFTFDGSPPTGFTGSPTYTSYEYFFTGERMDPHPAGLAVEVRMRATSPTRYFDDDIVFYKVYPFTTVSP